MIFHNRTYSPGMSLVANILNYDKESLTADILVKEEMKLILGYRLGR
jgi:hypothetical protein